MTWCQCHVPPKARAGDEINKESCQHMPNECHRSLIFIDGLNLLKPISDHVLYFLMIKYTSQRTQKCIKMLDSRPEAPGHGSYRAHAWEFHWGVDLPFHSKKNSSLCSMKFFESLWPLTAPETPSFAAPVARLPGSVWNSSGRADGPKTNQIRSAC